MTHIARVVERIQNYAANTLTFAFQDFQTINSEKM